MTKIRVELGLNPCEDWSEEDLDQYDEDASLERYADLCCDGICSMNADIEILRLNWHSHLPEILNWDEIPDYEEIRQDIAEVCLRVLNEFEWLLERM